MNLEPATPEQQPNPESAADNVRRMLDAVKSEGGATKENLILAILGSAFPNLDQMQQALAAADGANGCTPLSPTQGRMVIALIAAVAAGAARLTAQLTEDGQDVSEWGKITEEETQALVLAEYSKMIKREPLNAVATTEPEEQPAPEADEPAPDEDTRS